VPRKVLLVSLVLSVALLSQSRITARIPQPAAEPEKLFYSSQDRLRALNAASMFTPKAVAESDIVTGPEQKKHQFQLHFNDRVTCEFVTPGDQKSGNTPKFDCKITKVESADGTVQTPTPDMEEEPVKVKFGRDNREVYSETASTRLLWALGFYADAMYPVRLTCLNCPPNPVHGSGDRATRTFNEAVIERKFPGHRIYEQSKGENQGWSWKEFESLSRPSYQKDGLKMIAAFLIHSDNKPEQQRLVCEGTTVDQSTHPFTTTCRESKILIQDVGATFGGGGAFTNGTTAKMNLKEWSGKAVWKKVGSGQPGNTECQATLPKSWAASDGLGDPKISEEGRRVAAGLLCQLSDQQLTNLFKTARVSELPDYRSSDGSLKSGFTEDGVVQQWVAAFKQKREAVAAGRCQWKSQPSDLKDIDNPMGLATVPNFCSAHPF
jgi:hypothetical protein